MVIEIKIDVKDHGLASKLDAKAQQVNAKSMQLVRDLTSIAHKWVQNEAPRKTGKLKASVRKESSGLSGSVFVSKGVAPYCDFVIDGTRPHDIVPKGKMALFWPGAGHPVKKVHHPGTKSNPFVDKAYGNMMGEIDNKLRVFEAWLVNV